MTPRVAGRRRMRVRLRAHVAREITEQLRVEDPFRELPAPVDPREPVAVLPRQDRVQPWPVTCSTVK